MTSDNDFFRLAWRKGALMIGVLFAAVALIRCPPDKSHDGHDHKDGEHHDHGDESKK